MNIIKKIKNKLRPKKTNEEFIYKTFKCAKCEKKFSETKSGASKIELQYRTPLALLPTMCFYKLCDECGRKANIVISDFIYGASVRESEWRMNKERAKELINRMKELLKESDKHTYQTFNVIRTFKEEYAQALDIAIDSLEQNIQTIRVEREFDFSELDKGTDYLLTKMTEDFVREFVKANVLEMIASETRDIHKTKAIFEVKVVKPYERKE